jgi:glycerol-3-phosphate acyltransferase PlsY
MVPIVARMLVAQILAFLVGGIPFGYLIARARAGIDIREHGSGNIGATNCGRVLGFRYFLLVFLLDFTKGALPVLCARWYQESAAAAYSDSPYQIFGLDVLVGLAAILGHMFPVYLGLRGGKGVATSIGVISVLAPMEGAIGLAVWFLTVAATGIVALGSILFAVVFAASRWTCLSPWWQSLSPSHTAATSFASSMGPSPGSACLGVEAEPRSLRGARRQLPAGENSVLAIGEKNKHACNRKCWGAPAGRRPPTLPIAKLETMSRRHDAAVHETPCPCLFRGL